MCCKDWAASSITESYAYFCSPAISWEIWRSNLNLIVLLFCGTPDTSTTWFWFWTAIFLVGSCFHIDWIWEWGHVASIFIVVSITTWQSAVYCLRISDRARLIQGVSPVPPLTRCSVWTQWSRSQMDWSKQFWHTRARNKGWISGRTKVISALMDVSQWGDVAVQHLSVVKGFLCTACHIQLYSSFLFLFPFSPSFLPLLERSWVSDGKKYWQRLRIVFVKAYKIICYCVAPVPHRQSTACPLY